jgi:hypothetical protein
MKPTLLIAGLAALAVPSGASGQVVASERATLSQTVSGTEIVIDYSRPSARGRANLFGGQVSWGRTWTPGANLNTTLHFSKDVTLNGEDVSAGTYGVWIQPMEDEPWLFMLHEDTTLFHTMHPALEEGLITVPMARTGSEEFVETLRWDLQAIGASGADLTMAWGRDRVSLELGVDPGYVLTVDPAEAGRYVGDWTYDQTMSAPSDSMIAAMRAGVPEEERPAFDAYMAAIAQPRSVTIVYDEGRLLLVDPMIDAIMTSMEGAGYETVLMPRAEGIFEPGTLFRGDLALAGNQGLWEFEFNEAGQGTGFLVRDPTDEIAGRGRRGAGN